MDIEKLRIQNDTLRSEAIQKLRQMGNSTQFEDYRDEYMQILAKIELFEYNLSQLEEEFDIAYADNRD